MKEYLDNNEICKHGVSKEKWIGICDYLITRWGCPECHKERIREERIEGLKFLGMMFGMGFAIMGMMFFWISPLMYGIQWWNLLGIIVCTGICCLPMYLEYRENGKVDLTPRFLK